MLSSALNSEIYQVIIGTVIFRFQKWPFPFMKITNSVFEGLKNGNSVLPDFVHIKKSKFRLHRIRIQKANWVQMF